MTVQLPLASQPKPARLHSLSWAGRPASGVRGVTPPATTGRQCRERREPYVRGMADDMDGAFASYAAATLEGLLERQPEWATGVGDHRHDDRLTVGAAGYYEEASRWAGDRLAELAAIDADRLSPQYRVDAQILANQLTRRAGDRRRKHVSAGGLWPLSGRR